MKRWCSSIACMNAAGSRRGAWRGPEVRARAGVQAREAPDPELAGPRGERLPQLRDDPVLDARADDAVGVEDPGLELALGVLEEVDVAEVAVLPDEVLVGEALVELEDRALLLGVQAPRAGRPAPGGGGPGLDRPLRQGAGGA